MTGSNFVTLVELLGRRASENPDGVAYRYLADGETESEVVTYAELDRAARSIAARLVDEGAPGDRALLLFHSGPEFIAGFFGCLYAGVVAVPCYPPARHRQDRRLASIVRDAAPRWAITSEPVLANLGKQFELLPELAGLEWIVPSRLNVNDAALPQIAAETVAFLQYTSGSTAAPKGVIVTHDNIVTNLAHLDEGWDHDADSVMVTWLPVFHDMGLIYGALQPLYGGFPCVMMPPAAFLQRPVRWLLALSRYGGTHSAAPNFAFDLCARRVTDDEAATLDLSRWRMALNAAEPVREETMRLFTERFAPRGFSPRTFSPGFGLAEATLKVSALPAAVDRTVLTVDADLLLRDRVWMCSPDDANAREVVGCGPWVAETDVRIVDPESRCECREGSIGEIWVSGRTIPQGYWNLPEETENIFRARLEDESGDTAAVNFLRTGDLGFIRAGELYVTGRRKDLIIIRGLNHYPQDIELTAERAHAAIRAGHCAAFSVAGDDGEELVIVAEIERTHLRSFDAEEVFTAMRSAVTDEHDLTAHAIALIRTNTLPKTSSGKVQRAACRQLFAEGGLELVQLRRASETTTVVLPISAGSIRMWIVNQVASAARVAPAAIDSRAPFATYGIGSLEATRISGELATFLGRPLPPTLLYDYPTIDELVAHLAGEEPVSRVRLDPSTSSGLATSSGLDMSGSSSARPEIVEGQTREPIAIVGMACRFPGADNLDAFRELLESGGDAVRDLPGGREGSSRRGGFLENVDRFDARFFGIAPREAESMDPQQRMLLETAWHAFEDAEIAPDSGGDVEGGVFIGISNSDYNRMLFAANDGADMYAGTGNALSITANRISYALDLTGPSLAVDTACSSSLVAVHLACRSLRDGECTFALAGGVNLILSSEWNSVFNAARMMAPDGRCKTFDDSADGYVRGEGVGVVVLKRLVDAERDGDRIHAVILGSATNQDGRSNGLTAPSGSAQRAVIRRALDAAGVAGSDVGYIESHGTGTSLGDPIELHALRDELGPGRDAASPCIVGALKTNIGHLESAAGIAGLIKAALAVQRGEVPRNLHMANLNSRVDLKDAPFVFPREQTSWGHGEARRIAGVSSFGFGGTNAHVVLGEHGSADGAGRLPSEALAQEGGERAMEKQTTPELVGTSGARHTVPVREGSMEGDDFARVLAISAKSEAALRVLAGRYGERLAGNPEEWLEICRAAAVGRAHLEHRLAIVAASGDEARVELDAFAKGESEFETVGKASAFQGRSRGSGGVAFLYTGQGSQYVGMGRGLYQNEPIFRAAFDRCAEVYNACGGNLTELIWGEGANGERLNETDVAQSALFALQYALTELWRSWGVVPSAVIGHSVGEFAAACAAGVFSPEDGMTLIAERGRLMQELARPGEMCATFASEDVVLAVIDGDTRVALAAVNGPRNVVFSGESEAVREVARRLEQNGHKCTPLRVTRAFHSPLMEPVLEPFRGALGRVTFRPPAIPFASNVTGTILGEELASVDYWTKQILAPVRFADGLRALPDTGAANFLEIGPHPTLAAAGRSVLDGDDFRLASSLRRDARDDEEIVRAIAELFVGGAVIDWAKLYPMERAAGSKCSLPLYPFERERYWFADTTGPSQSAEHLYRVEWIDAPLEAVHVERSELLREVPEFAGYDETFAELNRRAGRHVYEAFIELGVAPGESISVDRLVTEHAVRAEHARLLGRLESILVEEGFAESDEWGFRLLTHIEEMPPRFEKDSPEFRMLDRCGRGLADVLTGKIDPLGLLFPGGDTTDAEELYRSSPLARTMNHAVTAYLCGVFAARPGHAFRILEIGAGTGGTTSAIAPYLPPEAEYVYTDVSPHFLATAKRKFSSDSRMTYRTLNIEEDPSAQGFAREQFDLIIAANVLHATKQLRKSVEHARQLLAPNGALVLFEALGPVAWTDLIFGLTDGWWRFADEDIRPDYPMLDFARWKSLLAECGYSSSTAASPIETDGALARYAVIAARAGQPVAQNAKADTIFRHCSTDDPVADAMRFIDACRTVPADTRLWLALPRDEQDDSAAIVAGLAKTFALEHPDRFGATIACESDCDLDAAIRLEKERGHGEDNIVCGLNNRSVSRLVPANLPRNTPVFRADATYLITGGCGGLGLAVAEELARRGVGKLVLVGRSGESAGAAATIEALRAGGVQVTVARADVGDRMALEEVVRTSCGESLGGIVHTAGVGSTRPFAKLDADHLREHLRAKVTGTRNLHELGLKYSADFLLIAGSMVGSWGASNQAAYVAANHFAEAFATRFGSDDFPVVTIGLGPLDGGMLDAASIAEMKQIGARPWSLEKAAGIFCNGAGGLSGYLIAAEMDWNAYVSVLASRRSQPFFDKVRSARDASLPKFISNAEEKPQTNGNASLLRQGFGGLAMRDLAGLARVDREEEVARIIRGEVAAVLGMASGDAIEPSRGFFEIGMDSLTAMELKKRLEKAAGIALPASLVFDHPTVVHLARHLDGRLFGVHASAVRAEEKLTMPALVETRGAWHAVPVQGDGDLMGGESGGIGSPSIEDQLAKLERLVRG